MKSTFIQEFKNVDDVVEQYRGTSAEDLNGATVYVAWYGLGDYCGSSIVIYQKDGKLYEVNGSHCSCNGLEECWSPEETSWEALSMRKFYEDYCEGGVKATEVIEKLAKKMVKKGTK